MNYGTLPPKLRHIIKKDLCKNYHEKTAEEIIEAAMMKRTVHFKGFFPDERNTDNAWTELMIIEIRDENGEHFANLEFSNPNGTLVWQKFSEGMVEKSISTLVERSKMTLEEKMKRGIRGAIWTVKNQGISGFAGILSELLSHSVTITGIAVTLQAIGAG
ncbi:Putative nudix hydrolase 6 [Trichuris trichiura]|uniref:Putative nudix hydrolase 6 n=1 Tax=Trichuris trichiura TaxID=36087 RepID=A0A077YZ48_TRITR|nr:Putative nudix hydrolase 6 [Trichuris trichiura]